MTPVYIPDTHVLHSVYNLVPSLCSNVSLIASDEELGWGLGMRRVNLTSYVLSFSGVYFRFWDCYESSELDSTNLVIVITLLRLILSPETNFSLQGDNYLFIVEVEIRASGPSSLFFLRPSVRSFIIHDSFWSYNIVVAKVYIYDVMYHVLYCEHGVCVYNWFIDYIYIYTSLFNQFHFVKWV